MRPLLTAFFCLMAPALAANEPVANGQRFGAWAVNCSAVAVGQTLCMLEQRILRSEDRAFVAQLLAFQSPDGAKTYLSARVPLGVYLPAGFAIRAADAEDVIRFQWQACGRDLCEALAEIEPAALAALSGSGTPILAAFRPTIQSEDFVFRFSLDGAPEGLAALAAAKN